MATESLHDVRTVMFDYYGTVVDMQLGLTQALTRYLADKGYTDNPAGRVVTWWRRTHFEYSMIDSLVRRGHTPYRQVGQLALGHTLDRAGVAHTEEEVARLVAQIERLEPFPDVVDALRDLQQLGPALVVLSNGDPDMLAAGVARSGTRDLWSGVISVSEAGAFKPHADTYATAARRSGVQPPEVLFVANHAFDCVGAKAAGMRTAFVDRRHRPFGDPRYAPDLVVDDFADLASTLRERIGARRG